MQMVGPWGRYLPQWLRAPCKGSGPAICQHTHTHTHWTLPTTMSVLETPFDIHVSSVYQTHTCMQAPIPTLCISAKKTHNKGSRTQPIMSTLMPRSGIPVICSRATLSCDSSYLSPQCSGSARISPNIFTPVELSVLYNWAKRRAITIMLLPQGGAYTRALKNA